MSTDVTLWLAGITMEGAFAALLLAKRAFRQFPIFCCYIVWALLSDIAAMAVVRLYPVHFLRFYLVEMPVDSLLQFAILVELAWSVLRPIRAALRRRAIVTVGVLIMAAGALVWPFASVYGFADLPAEWHFLVPVQQTVSILRILFFLTLAGCSQLLGIGWRNREMQVATGLGFYSLLSFAATVLHTYPAMRLHYHSADQIVSASYLCCLVYWVVSFAQEEAERREFNPQMQNLLLAMAGTARATRISLQDSAHAKPKRGEQ